MQKNTGEISGEIDEATREMLNEYGQDEYIPRSVFPNSPPTKKSEMVTLSVGDVHEFMGVPCRVVHINPGKKRFSLHPLGILKYR